MRPSIGILVTLLLSSPGDALAAPASKPAYPGASQPPPVGAEPVVLGADGGIAGEPSRAAAVFVDQPPSLKPDIEPTPDGDVADGADAADPHFLGFVGARHYPPDDERIDPRFGDALVQLGSDARPHDEVYGFLMLGKRLTDQRVIKLAGLGVRVLGFHPHHALRAAIPVASIPDVAALGFVRWVGVATPEQKVHPHLLVEMGARPNDVHDIYINAFESDLCELSVTLPGTRPVTGGPDEARIEGAAGAGVTLSHGWMHRRIEELGVEVDDYLSEHHAFRARIDPSQLQDLVELDFVQFVEARVRATAMHDESTPMISADWGRAAYDGSTSQSVLVGMIDSGVDTGHQALDHFYYVGWDETDPPLTGAISDECGHGSHMAGTILGRPPGADAAHRGVAPGTGTWNGGRFRFVKWLGSDCKSDSTPLSTVIAHFRDPYLDSFGHISPPPMVVNASWGTPGSWSGTELGARIIDDEVYNEDRVFVFPAGNAGPGAGTIGLPGVAKNALTVGAVYDYRAAADAFPGTVANGSSRGPCTDGRWKPNVTAPGNAIVSAEAGTSNGLVEKVGTSSAAAHVTGIVAQLADSNSAFLDSPERVAALLQATALTKDGQVLVTEGDGHLDAYGCGRVQAGKLLTPSSTGWTWSSWEMTPTATISSPTYEYADFVVPANTERLVVCMSYIEPAASAGASQALQHDWDLYVDRPPVDGGGNTGEYIAQQSDLDNTEIRILDDPEPGVWRWKAYPDSVLYPIVPAAKMSVTVVAITSDVTPNGSLTVTTDDAFIRPGEMTDVTAAVAVNEYVGSAVFLDSSAPGLPTFHGSSTELVDGPVTNLLGNKHGGRDVLLGDILGSQIRDATWSVSWPNEGPKTFTVDAHSDNLSLPSASVQLIVDGTKPSAPAGLSSPSHQPGVWSSNPQIDLKWPAATDNLSGVDGYSVGTTVGGPAAPDKILDTTQTYYGVTVPSSSSPYGVHVRTVDKSGNWSDGFVSDGPYLIDANPPTKPLNLGSTSHQIGVWSKHKVVTLHWTGGTDAHSGIAGYSVEVATGGPALPDSSPELGPVVTHDQTLFADGAGQFISLRTVDVAGNASPAMTHAGPFLIDNVAPSTPVGVTSTTHVIGIPSSDPNVTVGWTAADDAHSGVVGYDLLWDHAPNTLPDGVVDETSTTHATTLAASSEGWYFHVRAIDTAGNHGSTAHLGPIFISPCSAVASSSTYGIGKPGTFGIPQLVATSPPSIGATAAIAIEFAYPGALPILLMGPSALSAPYDGGFLLVQPTIIATLGVPISASGDLPLAGPIPFDAGLCGAAFYLQALIPDPGAAGTQQLAMTPASS